MEIIAVIENEQDKKEFKPEHEKLITDVIKATLSYEGFMHDCFVSVMLTDDDGIHEINLEQRNIDSATDVLSFPVLEFENGEMIENAGDYFEGKIILGDIVLSLERAEEQSIQFGHSYEREIGYLVCHSVLHLLGYDHENEDEREVMRRKEEASLDTISLKR